MPKVESVIFNEAGGKKVRKSPKQNDASQYLKTFDSKATEVLIGNTMRKRKRSRKTQY